MLPGVVRHPHGGRMILAVFVFPTLLALALLDSLSFLCLLHLHLPVM